MIVVDASVVVDYLLERLTPQAVAILADEPSLQAPDLIDYEAASALHGIALARALDNSTVEHLVGRYRELTIERHSFAESMPTLLNLRHNFTAYDAAYVVLAKALRAPLVTGDAKMLEAEKFGIEVRLFRP